MLQEGKFGYHEAISLIVITITSKALFTSPAVVAQIVGTAGWYMTLISAVTAILLFMFMYLLLKRFPGKNIMQINDLVLGKFFGSLLSFLLAVFLIAIAGINLREFSEILKIFVLPESPPSFIMIIFLTCIVVLSYMGLETLARFAKFFIYLLGAGFVLVLLMSTSNFETSYLHPLLGYGLSKTVINGLLRSSFYGEAALVGVIALSLQGTREIRRVGVYSILISGLVTSMILAASSMVFPYAIGQELVSHMYSLAVRIDLGTFLQRFDPIFLFLWNFSSFIEVTALYYGALMIYCHIFNISDRRPLLMPMAILVFSLNLIPKGISEVIGGPVQSARTWGWVVWFAPPILVLLVAVIRRKKGGQSNV